ncbi:hypothetical protein KEM54_002250 [Ascosphaera aggregata]|nr:hypothetical protein KEM54_002250 [Ascosphaera aggregata]
MVKIEQRTPLRTNQHRRHPSETKWQLLSSEDIGASIDGEIMVPETPPKEDSPTTEEEEEDEEFRCIGRRQAEYHHRPPVWRVEVLDGSTPEAAEQGSSSERLSVQLTPDEFAEWTDAHNFDSDAMVLSDEAVQRKMAMPDLQPRSAMLTDFKAFLQRSGTSASVMNGPERVTSRANWESRLKEASDFQGLSYPHNVWCCASIDRSTELTPGSRVIHVGNASFSGKERHHFGEVWVVRRLLNTTWAKCIRLEHDHDVARDFNSKVMILKPLNYPIRIFSAHIPLAALTLERHLATYFSHLQRIPGTLEPVVCGEVPYIQSDCERSCLPDDLDAKAIDRRMLAALFVDISFRVGGPESAGKSGAANSNPDGDNSTAIHSPSAADLKGSMDAMTYLLETPECRLCDPKENDEMEQKQERRKLRSTLHRCRSNKHVRRKVRSLFGSQAANATSSKLN